MKAFLKFLLEESVTKDSIDVSILADPSGNTFVAIMDKFAWYLAFNKSHYGKYLARNTVLSYVRQTKKWLLGLFNSQKKAVDDRLLKMAQTLDKYCLKSEQGGVIKKAPACSKIELHLLMEYLYKHATSGTDYQDAALVCLMWCVFGRASDLSLVQKQSLLVSASDVLFLRLVRVKTSEEQGLPLYPDHGDFSTCPIHVIALSLVMQSSPCAALLDQVPLQTAKAEASVDASVSLLEMLSSGPVDEETGINAESEAKTPSSREPGIHSYVNRILKRFSKLSGVGSELTSHSFRRSDAQHANGDHQLSAQ